MAIIKDIETSSLSELNIWAETLGLKSETNIEAIKRNIAKYYDLQLSVKSSDNKGKKITINRAELSKYYTIEEIDENIAEFEGRVEIVIDDTEKEIQHSIIADKINFNRTKDSFTALGNVEYTKIEKGKPELITAESLTFSLSNWKGSLIKCISKQDKVIDEENMVFYYVTGEIKKSDTAVMGMHDVTIQTVEGSPYFNISANDLWMLDSSDFVIISPFIKVGHVPVFWFPFYYHTENNLYFNPVYGVRSREGTVLQNTLYLMGAKTKGEDKSDFSFLSFENGESAGNSELNGLTLVSSDDKTTYSKDYSKLMIDYYSNLGLFIGSETSLNFQSKKTELKFETGLGFSRNIDKSDGTVFVNNESSWNTSYIREQEVPFRYKIDFELKSPIVNIDFLSLSDPYFNSDFMNREENFKWVDYFTDQLDDGVESFNSSTNDLSYDRDIKTVAVVSKLTWGVDFTKFSPNIKYLNPYIDKFEFDIKKISLDFKSKVSKEVINDVYTETYESFDPAYMFFLPDKLTIPTSFILSGNLFGTDKIKDKASTDKQEKKEIYKFSEPLFDISNPTKAIDEKDEEVPDSSKVNEDILIIKSNKLYGDIKAATTETNNTFATNFKYNIKIPFDIYGYWDDENWNNLQDINYDLDDESILYNTDPSFTGVYTLGLLDSFFTLSDTINGNLYLKTYLNNDDQDNLLDIYKWNKSLLENNLSLKINLLKLIPDIKRHSFSLSYDLEQLLYKKSFNDENFISLEESKPEYTTETFQWTEDYVDKNVIKIEYKYEIDFSETSLSYSRILPPLDLEESLLLKQKFDFNIYKDLSNIFDTSLEYKKKTVEEEVVNIYSLNQEYGIDFYGVGFNIDSGFDYSESYIDLENNIDEWDLKPITFSFDYKLKEFLTLSLGSEYSLENEKWEEYSGKISLGDLSLQLQSSYAKPVSWDMDTLKWITEDEDEVLKIDSLTLNHNLNIKKYVFWKNRVTLDIKSDFTFKKEFIKVDKSSLRYNLLFELDIFDFLTINLQSSSINSKMFQYWENDKNILGINSDKNIFLDFVKSFNFFSDSDRKDSNFNLHSISLDTIYKMPDWNLLFNYSGEPKLVDDNYEWYQVFSFFVEWKPLSLVRSKITNDDENWSVSTSANAE